ncbi:MAG: hypothetical protein OHK0012_28080 [Synechococcales cyanobacterium]
MPTVILSPCGTSTLTNGTASEVRTLLTQTADCQAADLSPEQHQVISHHLQIREQHLLNADPVTATQLSAELNGILRYAQGQAPAASDVHILLASDTFQGQATARLIQTWLQRYGCTVWVETIADLNVRSADSFHLAMGALVTWAETIFPSYQAQRYRIVFNLTGGFKSVNGFLQTLGMFYADECIYIFQGSQELLRIPRLPIKLDPSEVIGAHVQTFRRLSQGSLGRRECFGIPDIFLFQLEGHDQVALSEWGQLIWQRCKHHYYRQQLWDPLSPRLAFSSGFLGTIQDLDGDRLALINERLDQLSRCLDSAHSYNPRSLDFKKLQGDPRPPSTHECDAWSDQDARRLFGHFADGVFVLDALGKHL